MQQSVERWPAHRPLRVTSCMAPNADYVGRAVAAYLAERLTCAVRWVDALPWAERYQALDNGEIDVAWICGAPYIQRAIQPAPTVELLAAPVWRGARYADQPIYYAALVVHTDAPYQSWADLRGATWGYNEPNSFSGYHVVTHHLASLSERAGYFGLGVEVGSHQRALALLAQRQIDVAAIDSTVLEQAISDQPTLGQQLRTLVWLGPNPMPPWVVSTHLPAHDREQVRIALLAMDQTDQGQQRLATLPLQRFAAVTQPNYLPIAEMIRQGQVIQPARSHSQG